MDERVDGQTTNAKVFAQCGMNLVQRSKISAYSVAIATSQVVDFGYIAFEVDVDAFRVMGHGAVGECAF